MSTKTLMTFEQFAKVPEDENRYELDHGELITLPPKTAERDFLKNRIARILWKFLGDDSPACVWVESGFVLEAESYRIPDVSYTRTVGRGERPNSGAPDLAIEVHSPSNSPRYVSRKVAHLRESGVHTVWVVCPQFKEVQIVAPHGERWLVESDTLDAPELLPGFSIPVSQLFE